MFERDSGTCVFSLDFSRLAVAKYPTGRLDRQFG